MTALPSEAVLAEMRKRPKDITRDELTALLDCALLLRRLERWLSAHKGHSVRIDHDDGYGASCWEVELRVKGRDGFIGLGGDDDDLLAALGEALDRAEAKP